VSGGSVLRTLNLVIPTSTDCSSGKTAACLAFPGQQPFNTFCKFVTDSKQDFRPKFHFAAFHRGETVLADATAFGELLLRHIKAANPSDAAAYRSPVDRSVLTPQF
jgi:hypothetical protein